MSSKKDGATIVGVGAAACALCCVGPILGFLAAAGLGTVIGFALFGTIGLVVAVIVAVVFYGRRQRHTSACTLRPETVALESPTVRRSR